jgi:hypothetical protein
MKGKEEENKKVQKETQDTNPMDTNILGTSLVIPLTI